VKAQGNLHTFTHTSAGGEPPLHRKAIPAVYGTGFFQTQSKIPQHPPDVKENRKKETGSSAQTNMKKH